MSTGNSSSNNRGGRSRNSSSPRSGGKTQRSRQRVRESGGNNGDSYDDSEPLSLAEELAVEAKRGGLDSDETYERVKQGEIHIAEFQKLSMGELIEDAREENVADVAGMKKQDLIFRILKERVKMNGSDVWRGNAWRSCQTDLASSAAPTITTSPAPTTFTFPRARSVALDYKTGATVSGQIRPPKENERYFALLRVEAINFQDPNSLSEKVAIRRSDAVASQRADRDGMEAGGYGHARCGHDDADWLWSARLDRLAAAGPARRSCCRRWPRPSCTTIPIRTSSCC